MAKILCTLAEYDRLSTVLDDNPQYLATVPVVFEIVEEVHEIPKDFRLDTETDEFWVYRNKYTGDEIHIVKDPRTYLLTQKGTVT